MRRIRKAGRRDATEPDIIAELRGCGAFVVQLDEPVDLLVGWQGVWVPVEVKSAPDAPVTPKQSEFFQACGVHDLDSYLIDHIDDVPGLLKSMALHSSPAD